MGLIQYTADTAEINSVVEWKEEAMKEGGKGKWKKKEKRKGIKKMVKKWEEQRIDK